jgi:hypothetical protein
VPCGGALLHQARSGVGCPSRDADQHHDEQHGQAAETPARPGRRAARAPGGADSTRLDAGGGILQPLRGRHHAAAGFAGLGQVGAHALHQAAQLLQIRIQLGVAQALRVLQLAVFPLRPLQPLQQVGEVGHQDMTAASWR